MTNYSSNPDEKKKAIREIAASLCEWGVDPLGNAEHRTFQKDVVAIVESCFQSHKPCALFSDKKSVLAAGGAQESKLDKDFAKAVETVLRADFYGRGLRKGFGVTSDIFDAFTPPYFVNLDKGDSSKFFKKLKWEYNNLKKRELDPFARFQFTKMEKFDYFYKEWIKECDKDCIEGLVFEALVASQAIYNEACFHCKTRNSLRWNGGPLEPWTDMVCNFCDSAFEIKSKRNVEKMKDGHDKKRTNGGTYVGFHELHKQPRKSGWKHFAVLVSRMHSLSSLPAMGPGLHPCWIVQIAEIDRIVPRLKSSAFLAEDHEDLVLSIASQIETKPPLITWFKIPYMDVESLYKPLLTSILNEAYPGILLIDEDGNCKRVDSNTEEPTATETSMTNVENTQSLSGNDVEALRKELHNQTVSDCWDDSSDEEE